MTPEDFFDKMDYNRDIKYDAGSVMRMMEAYHKARTKADIKGLTNIRNYFGENDRTPFEHRAYNFLDTYIKSISESIN